MTASPVASARAEIFVTYHQMIAVEPGSEPAGLGASNLVATKPGAVAIFTGIHTGYVDVTLQCAVSPSPVDIEGWEEVEEVELISRTGDMHLSGLMDGPPENFPTLTPQGPGRYGMRVHARGRDINYDGTAKKPFEFYLVVVWPIEVGPDAVAAAEADQAPRTKTDEILAWAAKHNSPTSEPGRITTPSTPS